MKTIPFEKKQIKAYLDRCILYWRLKKEIPEQKEMAEHYIDAFQSVRLTIFGKSLSKSRVNKGKNKSK